MKGSEFPLRALRLSGPVYAIRHPSCGIPTETRRRVAGVPGRPPGAPDPPAAACGGHLRRSNDVEDLDDEDPRQGHPAGV